MLNSLPIFFANAMRAPKQVGAIAPASNALGKAVRDCLFSSIDSEVDAAFRGALIELGAGTGQLTKYLPKSNLTLVEINPDFRAALNLRFPSAKVVATPAAEFIHKMEACAVIVSSIPLINNPDAGELKQAIKNSYEAGLLKKLVTYSYGFRSPFGGCGFKLERSTGFILNNLPPAKVWVYV